MSTHRPKPQQWVIRRVFIKFLPIVAFAVIGVLAIVLTKAATYSISSEAESGNRTGNAAATTSDPAASGGTAIKFGSSTPTTGELTAADLERVRNLKIFFGHQSVGGYILQGIPTVFDSYGVQRPSIIPVSGMSGASGGYIAEVGIGQNSYPDQKNSDFNTRIRGGVGSTVKVAFFKYCYVDLLESTNVQALFNNYKTLMDNLVRDYPNVIFLYTTNPLTTYGPGDNVAREQYNTLIRQAYGSSNRLFDIAKVESTAPDGTRSTGTYNGSSYYQLYDGYSLDGGHPNVVGETALAKNLLTVIANATK
jgi:hypothetical protein